MEEMVHRERLRSWKRLTVEILNLASQVTRDPSIIGQVGDTLSDYYNMVVHNKGAYDLHSRLMDNSRYSSGGVNETSKEEMLKKLGDIPDV